MEGGGGWGGEVMRCCLLLGHPTHPPLRSERSGRCSSSNGNREGRECGLEDGSPSTSNKQKTKQNRSLTHPYHLYYGQFQASTKVTVKITKCFMKFSKSF